MINPEERADKLQADFLILQTGGLGDLVLVAELVAGLKLANPDATVALACRAPLASITRCYPIPPDHVVAIEFDPYRWAEPGQALFSALEPVTARLGNWKVRTFLAAELKPTWFDGLMAAVLSAEQSVGCFQEAPAGALLRLVLRHYGLAEPVFSGPEFEPERHERQRYRCLLEHLGFPSRQGERWVLAETVREQAAAKLAALGLKPGSYLTCFPLGAGPAVRWWPAERFRRLIRECNSKYGLPVLITGSSSEADALHRLAEGLPGVALFLGGAEDLPLLAGLIAHSRAYFGNDTGPVHLAAAFGVPGVTIYGGGAWPVYAPWAAGTIGLVHPLPCFGCVWDCMFGRGVCMEQVTEKMVREALRDVLRRPPEQPEVRTVGALPEQTERLIADADGRYREAQRVGRERLDVILELEQAARERLEALEAARREAEGLRAEVLRQQQAARERLEALEAATREAEHLRAEAARREQLIEELSKALEAQTRS